MSYLGVIIGAVIGLLLLHGFWGLMIGASLGYLFDTSRNMRRGYRVGSRGAADRGFAGPLFALLGAVAKSDGRVSQAEIAVAERLMARMALDAQQRQAAIDRFNAGKTPGFDPAPAIEELRQWCHGRRDLAFPVLDVVVETVLAEGHPSPEKLRLLRRVAQSLRISEMELAALMAMKGYAWSPPGTGSAGGYAPPRRQPEGPDPYAVLGVPRNADNTQIKRAYRKLIGEHHPDRLGDLPEDLRRRAEERAREINAAYEKIKSQRGFK